MFNQIKLEHRENVLKAHFYRNLLCKLKDIFSAYAQRVYIKFMKLWRRIMTSQAFLDYIVNGFLFLAFLMGVRLMVIKRKEKEIKKNRTMFHVAYSNSQRWPHRVQQRKIEQKRNVSVCNPTK